MCQIDAQWPMSQYKSISPTKVFQSGTPQIHISQIGEVTQMSPNYPKHPKTNCWNFSTRLPQERWPWSSKSPARWNFDEYPLVVDSFCEFIGWKYRKNSSTTLISGSKSLWEIHGWSDKQILSWEVEIGFTNMYLGRFLRDPVSLTQACQWAFWLERVALGTNKWNSILWSRPSHAGTRNVYTHSYII